MFQRCYAENVGFNVSLISTVRQFCETIMNGTLFPVRPGVLAGMILIFLSAQFLSAQARTLRIVSYNVDCSDQSSDGNITNSIHSLPTVVEAIGLHHLGTNAQPVDVMSCEELNSTSLANFCVQLNLFYGAGTYAFDTTSDPNTGGGPDGLIYRTNTVQVVSARALLTGQTVLLQSNGSYTTAHSPGGGVNGVTRAPMVYRLRPAGYGTNEDFYFYVSHARSTSDDAVGDARYAEAQEVRSDAKYNLPAGAHILYGGDWNLFNGSYENANTNQTQAYDPVSKTVPPTTFTFTNTSLDVATYFYDDATEGSFSMSSRLDIQLPNALMFAAYNTNGGMQLAPNTADPYDISNFPASQYPYAFETFGNNGSTTRGSTATSSSNHSLTDLANAATVYTDLQEAGTSSSSTFAGSDHYPIFSNYIVVVPPPMVSSPVMQTNQIQFAVTGVAGNSYAVDACTNISSGNWVPVVTNKSPFIFTDNDSVSQRYYRVRSAP